jgi:hypothetical protein
MVHGEVDKIVVRHDPDGNYVYFAVKAGHSDMVADLARHRAARASDMSGNACGPGATTIRASCTRSGPA